MLSESTMIGKNDENNFHIKQYQIYSLKTTNIL